MTGAALPSDAEFAALTAKITRERGFGCANYKDKCLRRRIAVRMRARGVHTYRDYARVLDGDAREYERLLDALTINVTRFFRNPEAWAVLDAKVLAPFVDAGGPPLRVWSAGCASGEETYTLGILLARRAAAGGPGARASSVLGTDIDKASLEAAERGRYDGPALLEMPPDVRHAVFPGVPPFTVPENVRGIVHFSRHDLLSDAPVGGPFDLIVCRNVTIYFDRASQLALLERFHYALRPGGAMMLGKVETLLGPMRSRFETVDARERIFRRAP
jgi:chemotaxis methyl-accepting protein methylase